MTNTRLPAFALILIPALWLSCKSDAQKDMQADGPAQRELVAYMDEYHRVLRPLMHQALPNRDLAAFRENAAELLKCSENLLKAEIPEKLSTQQTEIKNRVSSLLEKTRAFKASCETGAADEILEAFMVAHDEFEELADIVYKI